MSSGKPRPSRTIPPLVAHVRALSDEVGAMTFGGKVAFVYNPLEYAWEVHEQYLRRFGSRRGTVLLLGMNPGPWGMAQTGVPFGEITAARDWLGLGGHIGAPKHIHPKRPILGWDCPRSEVSGRRLWGWAKERYGTPERFFSKFFVHNYCPLSFMIDSGANLTPDKLPKDERDALFATCDRALANVVSALEPRMIIGVGAFARNRARKALGDIGIPIETVLHPSPASPAANRGWQQAAEAQLAALGIL